MDDLLTELRNPDSMDLDVRTALEIVQLMNVEDAKRPPRFPRRRGPLPMRSMSLSNAFNAVAGWFTPAPEPRGGSACWTRRSAHRLSICRPARSLALSLAG